jgi:hypothetical protein
MLIESDHDESGQLKVKKIFVGPEANFKAIQELSETVHFLVSYWPNLRSFMPVTSPDEALTVTPVPREIIGFGLIDAAKT